VVKRSFAPVPVALRFSSGDAEIPLFASPLQLEHDLTPTHRGHNSKKVSFSSPHPSSWLPSAPPPFAWSCWSWACWPILRVSAPRPHPIELNPMSDFFWSGSRLGEPRRRLRPQSRSRTCMRSSGVQSPAPRCR